MFVSPCCLDGWASVPPPTMIAYRNLGICQRYRRVSDTHEAQVNGSRKIHENCGMLCYACVSSFFLQSY